MLTGSLALGLIFGPPLIRVKSAHHPTPCQTRLSVRHHAPSPTGRSERIYVQQGGFVNSGFPWRCVLRKYEAAFEIANL